VPKKTFSAEQIVPKARQIEVLIGQVRAAGVQRIRNHRTNLLPVVERARRLATGAGRKAMIKIEVTPVLRPESMIR
jgi:hypothetical protein